MDWFDILAHCAGFEWDAHNAEKNWLRHGVSPEECEQIFFNRPLVAGDDVMHSAKETRYYVLGITDSERMLFVAFTVRSKKIRVITARDANSKERKVYESFKDDEKNT